jgi:AraC-like DNA-binding protein
MDGKRKTAARSAVAAREGRSSLPTRGIALLEMITSSWLNRTEMGIARRYLRQKLLARRNRETARQTRQRYLDGIHAIANKLHLSKPEYRSELNALTGCTSLNDMNMKQLALAFKEFRNRQVVLEGQSF